MTDKKTADCPRDPILRVVPRPADINANGHIFGGWVLGQIDLATLIGHQTLRQHVLCWS